MTQLQHDQSVVLIVRELPPGRIAAMPEADLTLPLAPEPFPSSAALAASILTGADIDQHRVTSEQTLHADGIGYIQSNVERMQLKPLWRQIHDAGGRCSVISSPLGTNNLGESTAFVTASAFHNRAGDSAPDFLAGSSVLPPELRPRILKARKEAHGHPVAARYSALLELMDDAPNLLIAWIPAMPEEDPDALKERIAQIQDRARRRGASDPIIVVAQFSMPFSNIQEGPRYVRPGQLHAWGITSLQAPLRPRATHIHGAIISLLGMESRSTSSPPIHHVAPTAGTKLVKTAKFPINTRLPQREQRLHEINGYESIGLHLLATARYKDSTNWLLASVEHPEQGIRHPIAILIILTMQKSGMHEQAMRFAKSVEQTPAYDKSKAESRIASQLIAEKTDPTEFLDAINASNLPLFTKEMLLLHAFKTSGRTLEADTSKIAPRLRRCFSASRT